MTRTVRTFGEVVDAHQVEVMRYLCRLTSNGAEAEDLFQETFLRALPAFGRLRAGSNHRAWLYRIATYVFLNDRRAASRRKDTPLVVDVPEPRRAETTQDRHAIPDVYHQAISRLPRRQRAAFVQRKLLRRTYAEIASSMGGSETGARANVYQAVRRLRRQLRPVDGNGGTR